VTLGETGSLAGLGAVRGDTVQRGEWEQKGGGGIFVILCEGASCVWWNSVLQSPQSGLFAHVTISLSSLGNLSSIQGDASPLSDYPSTRLRRLLFAAYKPKGLRTTTYALAY
jgi:hypothetical protein